MTRPALLALALALALVACGGGGDDAPPWRLTIEAKCAAMTAAADGMAARATEGARP